MAEAFASAAGSKMRRLWPAVQRELRWAAAILLLMYSGLTTPWSEVVYVSNMSGGDARGFGPCVWWTGFEWVAAQGRLVEKWRKSVPLRKAVCPMGKHVPCAEFRRSRTVNTPTFGKHQA